MSGFEFRPAVPGDRAALLAIAAKTWDGTDYLPYVLDEWLEDRDGLFLVALLDGRVVGCGKLSFLTPVDAWLEGLRKDPDVEQGGMAAAFAEHALRHVAERSRISSVRFATYVKNHASRAVHERLGFGLRAALSCKAWSGTRAETGGLARVAVAGVEEIRDAGLARPLVEASGWFEATGGLCPEGWRVYPYSWQLFRQRYIDTGSCLGVVRGGRLRGLAAFRHDPRFPSTYLKLVFFDAEDEATAGSLLDALLARAAIGDRDRTEIECMVPPAGQATPPAVARARAWLEGRGFASWEQEEDFLVYELPLGLLRRFSGRRST